MSGYLISAIGVIFLSVVVSLIIPEGKLTKTIMFIMRLVCIFVLVSPIATLFGGAKSKNASDCNADYAFVEGIYSEHQSIQLERLIKNKYSFEVDCRVMVNYADGEFTVRSVLIMLSGENVKFCNEIYEYLKELGYINITVYAQGT